MAIGIQTGVSPYQDFDDLFEPRQAGDPTVATTGVQDSNGEDISQLYVPLSFGGSAIANNTGVQNSGGTDCRNLFAAAGTVGRLAAPWDGDTYSVTSSCESPTPCTPPSSQIRMRIDVDRSFYTVINLSEQDQGLWLLNDNRPASDFEARVTGTSFSRNDYLNWTTISDTSLVISEDSPNGAIPAGESETTDFPATIEIRDKTNTSNSVTGDCILRHTFQNII